MIRNVDISTQNRTAALPIQEFDSEQAMVESNRRLRPLTVLECLNESPQPLTLAQLANRMRMPKSTLIRLLVSMEMNGYVQKMPAERGFVPGVRTVALSLRTLRGSNIRRECRAVLRNLMLKTGETCNLTVPDAGRVFYVERVETAEPLRMHMQPGSWVPMHCTASGKLFLASMSLLDRRSVLTHLQLTRSTPRTIVDRQELESELERTAKRGIGIDNEEFVLGMVAVAVPVLGKNNIPVAAVACHAPTARLTLDQLMANVSHLRGAAESIGKIICPNAL